MPQNNIECKSETHKTKGLKSRRSQMEMEHRRNESSANHSLLPSLEETKAKSQEKVSANVLYDAKKEEMINKVVMSKAQRRKLKKPVVVVTTEMKEEARQRTRELRKHLRMLKSNGARRKVAKLREKRKREYGEHEELVNALDTDYHIRKKARRLE